MGEFQVTQKIFSAKQNQSIKESLTQTLTILNIRRENRAIVLKPEQERSFTVFFIGKMLWQFCQLVLARACSLLSLLWLKKIMSSSKTCMITILPLKKYIYILRRPNFRNVVVELYSTGAYDRNSKFALRKSTSIFSITHVTDNNALHQTALAIVVDESHTIEERCRTVKFSMLGVALV